MPVDCSLHSLKKIVQQRRFMCNKHQMWNKKPGVYFVSCVSEETWAHGFPTYKERIDMEKSRQEITVKPYHKDKRDESSRRLRCKLSVPYSDTLGRTTSRISNGFWSHIYE